MPIWRAWRGSSSDVRCARIMHALSARVICTRCVRRSSPDRQPLGRFLKGTHRDRPRQLTAKSTPEAIDVGVVPPGGDEPVVMAAYRRVTAEAARPRRSCPLDKASRPGCYSLAAKGTPGAPSLPWCARGFPTATQAGFPELIANRLGIRPRRAVRSDGRFRSLDANSPMFH